MSPDTQREYHFRRPGLPSRSTAMDFASQDDLVVATIAMALHLPRLLRAFEDGAEDLGLEIIERLTSMGEDGVARPVLVLRGKRLHFHLGLRNAMEEFFAVDREAKPFRVDPGLVDDAYARAKIEDIVSGRMAILKVLEESRDVREAQERIGELADRFEWLRAIFVEERGPGV
jgi:hypothetical protein